MAMSSFEAGILVGCAAVVNSAARDLLEPMPLAPPRATAVMATPPAELVADIGAKCRAMTADHERMMTEMNAAAQRLDDLVSQMNAASGLDRVNETAAAVTEMVAQWLGIRNRMLKMEHEMLAHMMEHLLADKGAVTPCPMLMPAGGTTH
jgi:HAMP domain-containing protein